ncbi:MAG: hypothetical protein PHD25_12240, partial [Bacteroidales bacterium]|nr:hypothetical protein [Bacteroidales bacterium]
VNYQQRKEKEAKRKENQYITFNILLFHFSSVNNTNLKDLRGLIKTFILTPPLRGGVIPGKFPNACPGVKVQSRFLSDCPGIHFKLFRY